MSKLTPVVKKCFRQFGKVVKAETIAKMTDQEAGDCFIEGSDQLIDLARYILSSNLSEDELTEIRYILSNHPTNEQVDILRCQLARKLGQPEPECFGNDECCSHKDTSDADNEKTFNQVIDLQDDMAKISLEIKELEKPLYAQGKKVAAAINTLKKIEADYKNTKTKRLDYQAFRLLIQRRGEWWKHFRQINAKYQSLRSQTVSYIDILKLEWNYLQATCEIIIAEKCYLWVKYFQLRDQPINNRFVTSDSEAYDNQQALHQSQIELANVIEDSGIKENLLLLAEEFQNS